MATTVITGGTGGIARATAARLLEDDPDARVVLIDIPGATLPDELGRHGERVVLRSGDVTSPGSVREVADWVRGELGPIHGLVNTAGIVADTPADTVGMDQVQRMLDVHVAGTLLCCQAMAELMPDGGAIVNLGSIGGLFALPRRVAYSAAKGAIHAMTRTLAVEWAARGIRVNAVAPGIIETPMVAESRRLGLLDDSVAALHAMKRLGLPAEVAGAICFLLGPSASFITGVVLPVDGGYSAMKIE